MKGPFGGTVGVSHWVVELRREGYSPKPTREEWRKMYPVHRNALEANGFATVRYLQFRDGDKPARERAEREARAYAAEALAQTGVTMFIAEGCFL